MSFSATYSTSHLQVPPPVPPQINNQWTPVQQQHLASQSLQAIESLERYQNRARKASHSAIERRRRERMNDKIEILKTLLPQTYVHENMTKLEILQHTINHITELQQLASLHGITPTPTPPAYTSTRLNTAAATYQNSQNSDRFKTTLPSPPLSWPEVAPQTVKSTMPNLPSNSPGLAQFSPTQTHTSYSHQTLTSPPSQYAPSYYSPYPQSDTGIKLPSCSELLSRSGPIRTRLT